MLFIRDVGLEFSLSTLTMASPGFLHFFREFGSQTKEICRPSFKVLLLHLFIGYDMAHEMLFLYTCRREEDVYVIGNARQRHIIAASSNLDQVGRARVLLKDVFPNQQQDSAVYS